MGQHASSLQKKTIRIRRVDYTTHPSGLVPYSLHTEREIYRFRPCLVATLERDWSNKKRYQFLRRIQPGQRVAILYDKESGLLYRVGRFKVITFLTSRNE